MNDAALYFHYPCFDGLVSCVLAWDFLETLQGWNFSEFCPVDYSIRNAWPSRQLKQPCAIVDFLYHPQAEFWADHHPTTFLTKELEIDFQRRQPSECLLFDRQSKSCAALLFQKIGGLIAHQCHFSEMVTWADKIDSAGYVSVEEAIMGDAPALRINRTLSLDCDPDYVDFLRRELRVYDLGSVAQTPEVELRHHQALWHLRKGLQRVRNHLRIVSGEIAVFDVERLDDEIIDRYAPYYFAPDARYSIGIVRSSDIIAITAMRNPWREFESLPLGRIFEDLGGGGHQRVGAVVLPANEAARVPIVVQSVLSRLQGDLVSQNAIV